MNITHPQHTNDYYAGREAALEDVNAFGHAIAVAKWRTENPVTLSRDDLSLAAYYYAKGGLEALVETKPSA